jgi:hypothetical protein
MTVRNLWEMNQERSVSKDADTGIAEVEDARKMLAGLKNNS